MDIKNLDKAQILAKDYKCLKFAIDLIRGGATIRIKGNGDDFVDLAGDDLRRKLVDTFVDQVKVVEEQIKTL